MGEVDTGQVTRSAAEVYEELFVPALFGQFAEPLLEAAGAQPGDHVLDVGCGTGVVARAARRRVGPTGSVTAVDVNPEMLAVAARTAADVDWRRADAQDLPLPDGGVDATVSQFVLMFVPDAVAALREMARVTRPGGKVAVAVWSGLPANPGYAALCRLLGEQLGEQAAASLAVPFRLGDGGAVAELFEAASLDARVTEQPGTARFGSVDDWVDTEVRGWVLADAVDDAAIARLQDAARHELATFVAPDGRVAFPVRAVIASAVV